MVDSRIKGARGETIVRDKLRALTGLKWERTPGSGALDAKHQLKGDLYVPNSHNLFCVEVKNYAEDHLTSEILSSKSPMLFTWWSQCLRQADQVGKLPLLIFKFDRSKIFVAYEKPPACCDYLEISVDKYYFRVSLLEDWITMENIQFV